MLFIIITDSSNFFPNFFLLFFHQFFLSQGRRDSLHNTDQANARHSPVSQARSHVCSRTRAFTTSLRASHTRLLAALSLAELIPNPLLIGPDFLFIRTYERGYHHAALHCLSVQTSLTEFKNLF